MTFEIRLRAQHPCPFLDFSRSFHNQSVYGYCSREFDVLMIQGALSEENFESAKNYFPNYKEWKIITTGDEVKMTYIIMNCTCDSFYIDSPGGSPITDKLQKQGALINYPIVYKDGWEYHKITCLDTTVQKNVIKEIENIPEFEILSIQDHGEFGLFKNQMLSVDEIIGSLTNRQTEILTSAFEQGYYDIPRRIRTEDLAEQLEITRYGVEKVLRTAENKLIRSIMPFLYFKGQEKKIIN